MYFSFSDFAIQISASTFNLDKETKMVE